MSVNIRQTCMGCMERFVGCHSSCQRYLDAKAEYEAKRETILKTKSEYKMADDYEVHRQFKIKGKKKRTYSRGE